MGEHTQGGCKVNGIGNPNADIMIIGDAPSRLDAQLGIPFLGDVGTLLNAILEHAGIDRNSVYITNLVKCWPWEQHATGAFNSRALTNGEIKNCREYLKAEIDTVQPKVIIPMGAIALSAIEGRALKIMGRKGVLSQYAHADNTLILPTLHPSYILNNGGLTNSYTQKFTPTAEEVISHFKEAVNVSTNRNLDIKKNYLVVESRADLDKAIAAIKARGNCTFDVETTGLELTAEIVGIGFAIDEGVACYIPTKVPKLMGDGVEDFWDDSNDPEDLKDPAAFANAMSLLGSGPTNDRGVTTKEVLVAIKSVMEDESISKAAHNAKFDMGMIYANWDIHTYGLVWDTQCGAYIMNENGSHKLDDLKNAYLDLIGYSEKFKKASNAGKNVANTPYKTTAIYCCGDCDATYRLVRDQKKIFDSTPNYMWLMNNIYVPTMNFVAEFECTGVLYDAETAMAHGKRLEQEKKKVQSDIWRYVGIGEFNISSPQDLEKVLFGQLKLKPIRKTDTGWSTDAATLEKLATQHPVPKLITEYRHLEKMRSTYIERLLNGRDKNNRVHIKLNPTGTVTGRFSSDLQNIPREKSIKNLFIAPEGSKLIEADLSQAEVRCFAHYANEDVLRAAFESDDIDVHCLVAAEVGGIPYEEFAARMEAGDPEYKLKRQAAKGCLHPDMRIISNRGYLRIKDLVPDHSAEGFQKHAKETIVLNSHNTNAVSDRAFNNGKDTGFIVKTQKGHTFKGTSKHRIKVLTKEGVIVERRLRDIKSTDYAVIQSGLPSLKYIKGSSDEILKNITLTPLLRVNNIASKKSIFKIPTKLNADWGWFLGFIVGEGAVITDKTQARLKKRLTWTAFEKEVAQYSSKIANKLFGKYCAVAHSTSHNIADSHVYNIVHTQILDFLKQIGIEDSEYDAKNRIKVSAFKKDVPEVVWQSSWQVMQGFLQGFWDAEGTISKATKTGQYKIKIASASKKLIKNIQILMLLFGVDTKRSREFNKKYARYYHYLTVTNIESKKNFQKYIGFKNNPHKQIRLKEHITCITKQCTSPVKIPYQEKLLQYLYKHLPPTCKKTNQRLKDTIQVRIKRKIPISRTILQTMPKELLKDVHPYIMQEGIYFDQITKVTKTKFKTSFDLSVPGDHHYNAAGFVSHNTVFGLLYGRGVKSIAAEYGMELEVAQRFMDDFFNRFSNCKKWIDDTHAFIKETGFVYNIFGRMRRIPQIYSRDSNIVARAERQSVNSIIQSTAADITDLAMTAIHRKLKEMGDPAKIVLTVHDSIIAECPDALVKPISEMMTGIMETQPTSDFTVRLRSDADIYQAWSKDLPKEELERIFNLAV